MRASILCAGVVFAASLGYGLSIKSRTSTSFAVDHPLQCYNLNHGDSMKFTVKVGTMTFDDSLDVPKGARAKACVSVSVGE